MADYDLLDDYYFPLSDEDFENRYLKLYTHTLPNASTGAVLNNP